MCGHCVYRSFTLTTPNECALLWFPSILLFRKLETFEKFQQGAWKKMVWNVCTISFLIEACVLIEWLFELLNRCREMRIWMSLKAIFEFFLSLIYLNFFELPVNARPRMLKDRDASKSLPRVSSVDSWALLCWPYVHFKTMCAGSE